MKPDCLPKFGIGEVINLGRWQFKVFEIVWAGIEWRYRGNLSKGGRFWSGANMSERVLVVDGKPSTTETVDPK